MLFRIIYIIFFCSMIISCRTEKKQKEEINDSTIHKGLVVTDSIKTKESNVIIEKQTIIDFIKFYSNNYDSLYQEDFVKSDNKYYRIDFDNVNLFIQKISNTGFLSKKYIEKIKLKFKKIDSLLTIEKQYDGVPEGLEYDFILQTQEVDEVLDYAKQGDFEVLEYKNGCLVNFKYNIQNLYFEMKGTKINNISIP